MDRAVPSQSGRIRRWLFQPTLGPRHIPLGLLCLGLGLLAADRSNWVRASPFVIPMVCFGLSALLPADWRRIRSTLVIIGWNVIVLVVAAFGLATVAALFIFIFRIVR